MDRKIVSEIRECTDLGELYAILGSVEKQIDLVEVSEDA